MSGNSVINTNLKSLIAQDSSNINNRKLSTTMERLSTGNKINSAKDDAAGLAISTRMDSQIRGLNMAVKNAYDTVSLTETAEGAMEEVTNMLQRMRELALQAANDTNSDLDRRYIQDEIDQWQQKLIVFQILRNLTRSMFWMDLITLKYFKLVRMKHKP